MEIRFLCRLISLEIMLRGPLNGRLDERNHITCFRRLTCTLKEKVAGESCDFGAALCAGGWRAGKKKARALRPGLPGCREPALSMLMTDGHPGGLRLSNRTEPIQRSGMNASLHSGQIAAPLLVGTASCKAARVPGCLYLRHKAGQKCGVSHNLPGFSDFFHDLRRSQAPQRWRQG